MTSTRFSGALAAAFLALSSPALAHVSFENAQAAPNSTYKAVLRIPHGCDGQPTLKVRVRIPEGIVAVKPMPKAGWTLETTKGAYVRAYQVHGEAVSEGVTDIVWSGSLDDGYYDEFVRACRSPGSSTNCSRNGTCPARRCSRSRSPCTRPRPTRSSYRVRGCGPCRRPPGCPGST